MATRESPRIAKEVAMANVLDVASYILGKTGPISTWKLQKLVYYSQAWHCVWEERPLFEGARFEAWANGPVCPVLYEHHRGRFTIDAVPGRPDLLVEDERTSIDAVLDYYGKYSGQQLSDLTHAERPWKDARGNLPLGAFCDEEITLEAMAEYYGSLPPAS